VDRDAILQTALLGFGEAGNDNPIPPSWPDAYRSDIIKRDVAKAKALLAESGHGDGLEVELVTGASDLFPGMLAMVQAYKEMAAEAGITVNVVTMPADSFWENAYLKVPFVTSYWHLRPAAWALPVGYRSDAKYNETHWNRKSFDELIDRASATLDDEQRRALYKDAQRILADEGGVIVPVITRAVAAVRKGCAGYTPQVDLNRVDLSEVSCQ
jgi:peptide/nickel transport system substrate-binding protein